MNLTSDLLFSSLIVLPFHSAEGQTQGLAHAKHVLSTDCTQTSTHDYLPLMTPVQVPLKKAKLPCTHSKMQTIITQIKCSKLLTLSSLAQHYAVRSEMHSVLCVVYLCFCNLLADTIMSSGESGCFQYGIIAIKLHEHPLRSLLISK